MSREAEIVVALDLSDADRALALVDRLGAAGRWYKVGLELYTSAGPALVRELRARNRSVFLDLKLHDIPNTVAAAARAAADLGVDLLTVHASGGAAMIGAARDAVEGSGARLLGVTVLTALSADELGAMWGRSPAPSIEEEVLRLAELAIRNGAHGVVASPWEARALRGRLGPDAVIVTPGVRLPGEEAHDQRRVATPGEAALAGADLVVVGRTVTRAADPAAALARVREDVEAALGGRRVPAGVEEA